MEFPRRSAELQKRTDQEFLFFLRLQHLCLLNASSVTSFYALGLCHFNNFVPLLHSYSKCCCCKNSVLVDKVQSMN